MKGLAILNFSFDWQYITSSAMALPLNQQANSWIGVVCEARPGLPRRSELTLLPSVMYAVFSAVYWGDAFGAKCQWTSRGVVLWPHS